MMLIGGNLITDATDSTRLSSTNEGTGGDFVYFDFVCKMEPPAFQIKRKLTKQDKKEMFKIVDQKHSRRPGR